VKLKYSTQGAGEPLILLHGMFGSRSNLGLLGRVLSDKYMVIAPDLRNHGQSPHSEEMNYPCMANDIIRLMNDLNLSRAALIGHSMGGKIAMQVALNHANRINKIVIADISPVNYESDRYGEVIAGLNVLIKTRPSSRTEADKLLSSCIKNGAIRAFLLKNIVRGIDGKFDLRLFMKGIIANYHDKLTSAPAGQPFIGSSLFVRGKNSPYIQDKHLDEILRLFPRAQLKTINNAGHWLHTEKPEEFNQIIINFLNLQVDLE
jgi:esterase|tara:strand:+ start:2834 stop:3616 length:783 start_codon:yes stop_codon:yes gene_type:complete